MACRDAYKQMMENDNPAVLEPAEDETEGILPHTEQLLFGTDSKTPADNVLQNNLTAFQWVERNKLAPAFWGRNINGENSLTREEIDFLHRKACKIAALCGFSEEKETESQGAYNAEQAVNAAVELGIPQGAALFLEIDESEPITTDYLKGFTQYLLESGYTPGFRVNTDAAYPFDREYSRGLQTDREAFSQCLIWATAPTLEEYDQMTTTHLIHPDNWVPYAPSGITREEITAWQYGKGCHPIHDDKGKETVYNIDLIRDKQMLIDKMF